MRYTQHINVTDWNILGLLLGLSKSDLQTVEYDYVNYRGKHMARVTKWLEGGSASWATLVNGLKDPLIGRNDIAKEIVKDHPKGNKNNYNNVHVLSHVQQQEVFYYN